MFSRFFQAARPNGLLAGPTNSSAPLGLPVLQSSSQGAAAALLMPSRNSAWWAGGPWPKGKKRKKFLRVGESLYKVKNYRLAYRRFFGCDVPEQERLKLEADQRRTSEMQAGRGRKAASNPPPLKPARVP